MAFMARALSLAGILATVKSQEYKEVTPPTTGHSSTCAQLATAGEWQDLTEAECQQYAAGVGDATFEGTGGVNGNIPCGCTTADFNDNKYYYKPCGDGVATTSSEYHHICIKTMPTTSLSRPVTCQTMTCLERFVYWCQQSTVGFGSNNNEAPANSPKDILVAECPDCTGAANTDTCPTNLRLYDAAPEAEPTSELDKTSVAVLVPLGLVSALVAMGAVVGVSRIRASNQPVLVENEQDLLRE
ncbi:unnamed protein product [Prorocentrum cordatum]|uniref:Uncharacterized protein n=1 Tax=Prorocentrum cordatum TaxID=2364126 RepID=A0ABN9QV62_9DINO|nr:unnamed protein product [Polarella glacialis]